MSRARRRATASLVCALVAACVAPGGASAHVTLVPSSAPAGSWTTFQVRVPNESDSALTVKVALKVPPGVAAVSWQPVPGWSAKVVRVKLAKPIETDDGPITEAVSEVVWTASGGGVAPGQFQMFPVTFPVPDKAGDGLTFKAVQTYSDGHVSRWIGAPGSDEPAPVVDVTESGDAAHGGSQAKVESSDDSLSIAALVVAGLAFLTAGLALLRGRGAGA